MSPTLETALPTFITAFLGWLFFVFATDDTNDANFISFTDVLGTPKRLIEDNDKNWLLFKNAMALCWLDRAVIIKRAMRRWLMLVGWLAFCLGFILGMIGAIKNMPFLQEFGLRYCMFLAAVPACADKIMSEVFKRRLKTIKNNIKPP